MKGPEWTLFRLGKSAHSRETEQDLRCRRAGPVRAGPGPGQGCLLDPAGGCAWAQRGHVTPSPAGPPTHARRTRRGSRGAGGSLWAAVGTVTVEGGIVGSVGPDCGSCLWVASVVRSAGAGERLGISWRGWYAEREGARLVSGLSWAAASLSRPVCGLAWLQRPAVHSSLLPTCWVEQREDSFLRPDVSFMGALWLAGTCGPPHLDLGSDLGMSLKHLLPRDLETVVAGTTGSGRGSVVSARSLGDYNTNSVQAFRPIVKRVLCSDCIRHSFGTLSQAPQRSTRAFDKIG